ncbi:hypothetical protein PTKIN_Ptkin06aG0039700 [Pterospermum kingtungense]
MGMKLLVLFLVLMMVSSSCRAGPRRAMIDGTYRQEQRHDHVHVGEAKAVEDRRNRLVEDSLEKNIDNHHNIPRNEWGNNSPGNSDNGGDGSG